MNAHGVLTVSAAVVVVAGQCSEWSVAALVESCVRIAAAIRSCVD